MKNIPQFLIAAPTSGAGKTTVFNMLTRVYQPTRGTILFLGEDTAKKSVVPYKEILGINLEYGKKFFG
mgnify:CR=1 FL=1